MPFLFIFVGLVCVVSAARGTTGQLLTLLKSDVTGKGNYLYWMVSIFVIGAVGYIQALRPLSRGFLVLVVIVLFLTNGGVFQKFMSAINMETQQSQAKPESVYG